MNDANVRAGRLYRAFCAWLEEQGWPYRSAEEGGIFSVRYTMTGDDLAMRFSFEIDGRRETLLMRSVLPFALRRDLLAQGALAVTAVNNKLTDGNFEVDPRSGEISFRMSSCFCGAEPDLEVVKYILAFSAMVVDDYNDKFLALNEGKADLMAFLQ